MSAARNASWLWVAASLLVIASGAAHGGTFIRGDANQDRIVDISDPRFTLGFLFLGSETPGCLAAADANDDEVVDISDALATLAFLFLGDRRPPAPFPAAGLDPTPGLPCGLDPPSGLACRADGPAVVLSWAAGARDAIEVLRDGALVAALPGSATSHVDRPAAGGTHDYGVRGVTGGQATGEATCRVAGLPANRAPTLTLLAPGDGAVVAGSQATVRARVTDDGDVVRVVIDGADVTPAGPPAVPYEVSALVDLPPGPGLIRVQAVDDFGRSTFRELAVGREPLLPAGGASQGVELALSATGYDEIERVVRPFIDQVPALLDQAIAGVVLYNDSLLGVGIRVTGDRAEVLGATRFDLFPSADSGGRVGLAVDFERIRLLANGRSDFGFLGTDAWTALFDASAVRIETRFVLNPLPGGGGLDIVTDGFVVTIGSSSTSVSGFLDPLGIFDGIVNALAGILRQDIENAVRTAVEGAAQDQLVPVLEDAFQNLRLDLDLGDLALGTAFHDVLESAAGLAVQFDAAWTGGAHDPAFPRFPGSSALRAPYPMLPLAAPVGHAVDATISLAADTLNQALLELTATGLLSASFNLADVEAPLPLVLGTVAAIVDERLLELPGVSPDDALGIRIAAEMPAAMRLGAGVLGRSIVGQGAIWRYRKGTSEPPASWKDPGFDDTAWERGPSGFGYSTDESELRAVRTPLADMQGAYTSVYARVAFQLASPAALTGLLLHLEYDDGFVAYLNGTEVARAGVTGSPPGFAAVADVAVEPTEVDIDLGARRGLLRAGDNVLAIHGVNAAIGSSDFVIVPQLVEPAPLAPGALGRLPVAIDLRDVVVTFVADTAGDGVGATDAGGPADDVDLFAYKLAFSLQSALLLLDGGAAPPTIAFELVTTDGPDADEFPDALVGGAAGIEIGIAREAIDLPAPVLVEFAQLLLSVLAPSLGEALTGFELPAFPIPELAFDLDGDGAADVRLDVARATLAPVDTTGDGKPDWVCILGDLRAASP